MTERKTRKEIRNKPRRLIWNNDGSDMLGPAYATGAWPPLKSIKHFIDNLMRYTENTEVDALFYCGHTNEPDWEHPQKNIEVLGPTPIKHAVDFAHKNEMEFFYAIRMNDTHASYFPPKGSYWPPFRLNHPEFLLANVSKEEFRKKYTPWISQFLDEAEQRKKEKLFDKDPEYEINLRRRSVEAHPLADVLKREGKYSRDLWSWAGYNYARPEVRTHYLDIIRGACERYNLEGIELDWLRMPMFFELGQERRNIPIMNNFVRQIRKCLDEYGKKRGRPILLAMRIPDTIDLSLSVGLDPETWAREGIVDFFMAGSGLMPFSIPMSEWVDLGRKYDVKIYGCLDRIHPIFHDGRPKFDTRNPEIKDRASNNASVYAAAYRFWKAGVDGIYLFDWHTHHGPTDPKDYGTVPKVSDVKTLKNAPKLYQVDPGFPVRPGQGALAPGCLTGQLPCAFTTKSDSNYTILTIDIADTPKSTNKIMLLTQWTDNPDPKTVKWYFNNTLISTIQEIEDFIASDELADSGNLSKEAWLGYNVPPRVLKKGLNALKVVIQPKKNETSEKILELLQVRIAIS